MRKLLFISILFIVFTSCTESVPIIEEIEIVEELEYVQTLTGEWLRFDQVVQFYDDGTFRFYDYYTYEDLYNGFYIDYVDTVYIEDYGGAFQTYEYFIVYEDGNYILRWKTLVSEYWVDYVLIK